MPQVAPAPPTLQAVALAYDSVQLTWVNNAYNADSLTLEQSTDEVNWSSAGTIAAGTDTLIQGSLEADTRYFYRLTASNSAGQSSGSTDVLTPLMPVPESPTGLTLGTVTDTQVSLSWQPPAGIVTSQTLEILDKSPAGWPVASSGVNSYVVAMVPLDASASSYTATLDNSYLTYPRKDYYFAVCANNATGSSLYSNVVTTATHFTSGSVPNVGSDLSVTSDGDSMSLSFDAGTVDDTTAYAQISVSEAGSSDPPAELYLGLGSGYNILSTSLPKPDTTYTATVQLCDSAGYAPVLGSVSVHTANTFPMPPAPPAPLSASAVSSTAIDVQTDGDMIEAQTVCIDPYGINEVPFWDEVADSSTLHYTGLEPGTTYYISEDEPGGYTEPVAVTTSATPAYTVSVQKVQDATELGPDGQASNGYFQFTRVGDLNQPLTVNYSVGDSGPDSATPGYEYTALPGSVLFGVGQSSVLVPVMPREINHVEGTTSVLVNIYPDSPYTITSYQGSATANIVNTDDAMVTISANPIPVGTEGSVIAKVTNHYDRPLYGPLQIANDSPALISIAANAATTGMDGAAVIPVLGVAVGTAVVAATPPAGIAKQGNVPVVANGIDVTTLEFLN